MFKQVFIFTLLGILISCKPEKTPIAIEKNFEFQNGDIIFQTSLSSQSLAIQLATQSTWSHVGMIYLKEGEIWVFEAVQPIKFTSLDSWQARGLNGKFEVLRLKEAKMLLDSNTVSCMKEYALKQVNKNYDLNFEWSDERMYCSELVWKIYKECTGIQLGELKNFADYQLNDPLVQAKIKERFPNGLNLSELVLSPDDLYHAEQLEVVYSN